MVGEGVLLECLQHDEVAEVLVVGRKSCGVSHPKLREIIHMDLFDLSGIEDRLSVYDTCLFCLGVSSVGMKEADYTRITYDLTLHFAKTLASRNTALTFCYISGAGTDSSEKGRLMWARVKGKTENDLATLPFKTVYSFRPGFLIPSKGAKNVLSFYRYIGWLMPILRKLAPKFVCSLSELGQAMINASLIGYEKKVLEGNDILDLSKRLLP